MKNEKEMFTASEEMKSEYCAQIVRIGKLEPIENSDFLVKTMIGGAYQVVVGKNDVNEGDIMIYCKLETSVNNDFLSVNNQFELSERKLNSNFKDVQKFIDDGKEDEAKKMCGYFNRHGRVRIVKLRGCPSEGCLFTIDSLVKWNHKLKDYDYEKYFIPNEEGIVEPFNFDTVDGKLFVKAYVPKLPDIREKSDRRSKMSRKAVKKFNRMVDGQFRFHYDTNQLNDNMWRIKPDTDVTVSCKFHGTSHIVGNLLVRKPKCENIVFRMNSRKWERELKYMSKTKWKYYWQKELAEKKISDLKTKIDGAYTIGYGKITSSRSVIKNQFITRQANVNHYYKPESGSKDVWNEYGDMLYRYLPEGMTLYSEIVGYVTGSNSMIQKGYDYGCESGRNVIMPYRITFTDENGNVDEWNVEEVYGWTLKLIKEHPELEGKVRPVEILYHGNLNELYPDIDIDSNWNTNVLARMREDKEHFGMEQNEPFCKTKVPREGIVVRIDNDVKPEAFKLKTFKFLGKEAESIDRGEVDNEMELAYGEQ